MITIESLLHVDIIFQLLKVIIFFPVECGFHFTSSSSVITIVGSGIHFRHQGQLSDFIIKFFDPDLMKIRFCVMRRKNKYNKVVKIL